MAKASSTVVFDFSNHSPPVEQEYQSRSAPLPALHQSEQPAPLAQAEDEPQELPIAAQQQKDPDFLKSIDELGNLSVAIHEFKRRFDELKSHLDFIQNAIGTCEQHPQQIQPPIGAEKQTETGSKESIKTESAKAKASAPAQPKSELKNLCETTCGRGLRRYVMLRLSDISKLRREVPSALKCAPDPAKLVLDCVGRFYLQGSRAYNKDSQMIPARKSCILVLECFLLMLDGQIKMDPAVRQEAEQAAVAWRRRLITEGGVYKASEIDGRGLLFLVACYGFPKEFKNKDIWDLVQVSNSRQIAEVLRRSPVLVGRVSDIMEGMMNKGMKIEAVDVASTFGMEDRFPPRKILTSFLRESKEAFKIRRNERHDLPILLKEANEKQLAAFKSVMKFLEDRHLDPMTFLPGWQLKTEINKLEDDIADLNKKIDGKAMEKRKTNENELKIQETKRPRFTAGGSAIISPSVGFYEQRAPGYVDGKSSYNDSMQINLLDGGYSSHINNYPACSSALYGTDAVSLTENVRGMTAGAGVVMHTAGVSLSAVYGIPSTGSFAGANTETVVDRAGQIMGNSGHPYARRGVGDAALKLNDGLLVQRLAQKPASSLFGPSLEGFVGLPNSPRTGAANWSSASDLYRFADAVVEGEYSRTSRKAAPLPVGAYRSSYV